MTAATTRSHDHRATFAGFDDWATRVIGTDMRLFYGLGVPILGIVGLLTLLALEPAEWLVVSIVVLEIGGLALIVSGLMAMMSDDGADAEDEVTAGRR